MKKDKRILMWLFICVLVIVLSLMIGRNPRKMDANTAPEAMTRKPVSSDSWRNTARVTLSFDLLKKWTYVAGKATTIPDFIRAFDGKNVEMNGYMMLLNSAVNIRSFVLVPSLFGCCYGQPPAVNHIVLVNMADDKTAKYFEDAVRVRGRFNCGEAKQDGELLSLYWIDADVVVAK
jgi:hypothetical protein